MKPTPVICGIDLGSWSFKICVFNGQKFQVLTNEANFRETPSLVAFTETQRLMGESALIKIKNNFANTIRAPHRLLGLQKHEHLLQEELKYEKLNFKIKEDLLFSVLGKNGNIEVSAEEILISLLSKVRNIIQTNNFSLSISYFAVPTYLGQQQRSSIVKCGQLALKRPVRLLDDWIALATQYTYNRIKELKSLEEMRYIVFIDVGYSKVNLYLVQFTRFQGRLIDWEYLPYTGCKNMDHLLVQFYSDNFQQKFKHNIIENTKAYIKLLDAVQKERSILSANNEHHMSLQYLLADQDLTYNMQRQDFETIIVPILADIAAAFAAMQSRNSSLPLYAIELMGGASRIPCIQNMAAKIFGIEPSRSLNQSESMAVGSTIFGALQRKLLNLQFNYDCLSTKEIVVKWGKEKQIIFNKNSKVGNGAQYALNVGHSGMVNMQVYVNQGVSEKQIGRLQFKAPNKVIFTLNQNKILSAKLSLHQFQLYDMGQKAQSKWKLIMQRQNQMSKIDERMNIIYEMKNDYESKLYWSKNKYEQLQSTIISQDTRLQIQEEIEKASLWIEQSSNQKILGSESQLQKIQHKLQQINNLKKICQELQAAKNKAQHLKPLYNILSERISAALDANLNEEGRQKVMEIMSWASHSYQQMQATQWNSNQLTSQNLEELILMIESLMNR